MSDTPPNQNDERNILAEASTSFLERPKPDRLALVTMALDVAAKNRQPEQFDLARSAIKAYPRQAQESLINSMNDVAMYARLTLRDGRAGSAMLFALPLVIDAARAPSELDQETIEAIGRILVKHNVVDESIEVRIDLTLHPAERFTHNPVTRRMILRHLAQGDALPEVPTPASKASSIEVDRASDKRWVRYLLLSFFSSDDSFAQKMTKIGVLGLNSSSAWSKDIAEAIRARSRYPTVKPEGLVPYSTLQERITTIRADLVIRYLAESLAKSERSSPERKFVAFQVKNLWNEGAIIEVSAVRGESVVALKSVRLPHSRLAESHDPLISKLWLKTDCIAREHGLKAVKLPDASPG